MVVGVPGLDATTSNGHRGCEACCLVLCCVRRTQYSAYCFAAGYCGTHGGVLVGLAGTALLSADGFNATSQSAQSQPALNLPFAPPIPSLLGSHPEQQHLRTSCRRPGVKLSEWECERAGVVG